jgi:hypothetical protein
MVWRKRIGLARVWSLLTHAGILLVLVGALVTLVWAERGYVPLEPGMVGDRFWPYGVDMRSEPGKPLGFRVRLVDFDIDFHRPPDVIAAWRGEDLVGEARLRPGREVAISGTGLRIARPTFTPDDGPGIVEYTAGGGARRSVPAEVGTVQELSGTDASLRIMLYLPSFVVVEGEEGRREIASETFKPRNPALHVALVRGGETERPRWLFARAPGYEHMHPGRKGADGLGLRFMHPSVPTLEADVVGPAGTRRVRIESGGAVRSPWGDGLALQYARDPFNKVSDYRSEVEVIDGERVVRRHVITVNSPLAHEGTKLSQADFDQEAGLYTVLGVSRDPGVWFVYAGFLAGVAGVMGRFYLVPLVRKLRARFPRRR